jgi:hypothetical protein
MKKLYATIGKIIFYVFVLSVAAWTASLTLGEMKAILPNDPLTPYFALALFDGGAIAWLTAWLGHARGLYQRSISVIMLVLDLAGVVLLSSGRLLGGGQSMVDLPQALSAAVIYGVIGATLINLAAIYAFHITDPDTMEEVETSILEDTLREEAMKQAQANIASQAQALGAILAARATGQLKYRLRLPMAATETAAMDVIDVQSIDVQTPTTSQQPQAKAPRIIQARQKSGPQPMAGWLIKTLVTAREKLSRPQQPATVYEQTAPAPAVIEPQPDRLQVIEPTNQTSAEPNKGDDIFPDGTTESL